MKTKFAIIFALLLTCISTEIIAATIKGNGNVVTRQINVSEFEEIEIGVNISSGSGIWGNRGGKSPVFHYTQSKGSASLEVTIDENLFSLLDISSSKGKLIIKSKKSNDRLAPTQFEAKGSSRNLQRIRTSGATDFYIKGAFSGDDLDIQASGGSDIYLRDKVQIRDCKISVSGGADIYADQLFCNNISCSVSGGADAALKGKATNGNFKASGGADIKAYDFILENLECHASGGADIHAYASRQIKAHASGGADIRYKGNPQAETSKSGGGSVKQAK